MDGRINFFDKCVNKTSIGLNESLSFRVPVGFHPH